MTFLETILALILLLVVPWCVWSGIDLWRLRRDLDVPTIHRPIPPDFHRNR